MWTQDLYNLKVENDPARNQAMTNGIQSTSFHRPLINGSPTPVTVD